MFDTSAEQSEAHVLKECFKNCFIVKLYNKVPIKNNGGPIGCTLPQRQTKSTFFMNFFSDSRAIPGIMYMYIARLRVFRKIIPLWAHLLLPEDPILNRLAGHPYLLLFKCLSISHRRLKALPQDGHRCVPRWMCRWCWSEPGCLKILPHSSHVYRPMPSGAIEKALATESKKKNREINYY